ncbi:flagellar basal body P-ring formation chaperone FlgA [Litoreibacter arenae]|uniref:flagellar basal body P-ring formation chaperone FlgA n=1 Tax=Litoreibacter arenae TaxID=491388 RepID=UPI0005928E96|nr:flagellar basal body P-ring formation chaperone FlgA [Litoreibacter arenae]
MIKIIIPTVLALTCACQLSAQTVVPLHTIRAGDTIAAADVRVVDSEVEAPISRLAQVIGLEAKRALYRDRPIQENDIGPPALVERNAIVALIYQTRTLSISTEGRALARGALGERIKVINLGSRNAVVGRVTNTGEVVVSEGWSAR